MGVLNITPNSFSDGGRYIQTKEACERALQMVQQGADIIDVGGEATNPGAAPVSIEVELSRVIPVIRAIRDLSDVCISIDTSHADVMSEAVDAGATMINDISALTYPQSLQTVRTLNVPVCLMHMKGTPKTMQNSPWYEHDVVDEIHHFFHERIEACLQVGIPKNHLIIDPGIGFGKSTFHNLTLLHKISEFNRYQLPILLGVSRKRFIGDVLNKTVSERLIGGITIATYALTQGVKIIRTHDVDETKQVFCMMNAIESGKDSDSYPPHPPVGHLLLEGRRDPW